MRYVFGNAPESDKYTIVTDYHKFADWMYGKTWYMLDIETNVTPHWSTKILRTIQFGDDNDQWLLQYSTLNEWQRTHLKQVLENANVLKIIHNAMFEGVVLRFHGIEIENIYDTMLAEKVLDAGMTENEEGYFSLAGLTKRYLGKYRDKTEQTGFNEDILTEAKVIYALDDVTDMAAIRRMQMPILTDEDQDWVAALENEALLSYIEMTYYGMKLNKEKWLENVELAKPLVKEAERKLNDWLIKEPFYTKAKELGAISDEDRIEIKWTSPKQRGELLKLVVPELEGASKGIVQKFIKHNQDHPYIDLLRDFVNKEYTLLEQTLVNGFKDYLIFNDYLVPAGTPTINWNSQQQVLPLFQTVERNLTDLSAESFAKTTHPIIKDLEDYKDNLKLVSSYGEKFIEKFVEPDGQVRSSYNQIVSTGRISSRNPNKQNIPAKESVGNRYRNAFEPPEGWSIVSSDMASQELCIISDLSKDPVWTNALQNGSDLHSVCAELVFGRKWKEGAEEGCAYYHKGKQKCGCKKHKSMRQSVKTINFGLAYGMSAFKLSGTLKISLQEAKDLIKDYFKAFPRIEKLLTYLGNFGVWYGYSKTMAPFFRKRRYPFWKYARKYIKAHISGVEYNGTLGEIERAAKNQPVQGSGADQIKLAIVMIRWAIRDNKMQDRIHIIEQVHDQNDTAARNDVADWWKDEMTRQMEAAAKVFIKSGLLKAETTKTPVWSK